MKPLRLSAILFGVIALAALLACPSLRAANSSQTSKAAADTLLPKDQRKTAPGNPVTDRKFTSRENGGAPICRHRFVLVPNPAARMSGRPIRAPVSSKLTYFHLSPGQTLVC